MPCPNLNTLTPFLYPFSESDLLAAYRFARRIASSAPRRLHRYTHTAPAIVTSRLNPTPDNYATTPFTDRCTISLHAGSGGNGCVSFVREKFISEGPPNGGDGGSGGNIYIQAIRNETSLHKVARIRDFRAGRGGHGQGSSKGGQRGEDIVIQVPVGTVVRELSRWDPVAVEEELFWEDLKEKRRLKKEAAIAAAEAAAEAAEAAKLAGEELPEEVKDTPTFEVETIPGAKRREKWLLYPGANLSTLLTSELPDLPRPERSSLAAMEPRSPIRLDLDEPMERPLLLAAGALGGHGNPHFAKKEMPRPKFATKGNGGLRLMLHLELKLLADVGLVGLPNAGKSTLLRAVSNSRARVGSWAFTTLQPNIGTVVLDDFKGRPRFDAHVTKGRTKFTIADIPGLIEDAHLDKGLGLDFLRHVERAAVLAFVLDLSAGDAVAALKALWREVSAFEQRSSKERLDESAAIVDWQPLDAIAPIDPDAPFELPPLELPPMSGKPWFVVATKADLEGTQDNFARLQAYLNDVAAGAQEHPSGHEDAWKEVLRVLPVSAIQGAGVEQLPEVVLELLDRGSAQGT